MAHPQPAQKLPPELLKGECHVSRTEHIIAGERRCTYTLTPAL